jgi:hypothetical protein
MRPLIGLLCQLRVITRMMKEKLVEWWLAGEAEVFGEKLPQCRFVHDKSRMHERTLTRAAAVGSQGLTAWATARPTSCITAIWIIRQSVEDFKCTLQYHIPSLKKENMLWPKSLSERWVFLLWIWCKQFVEFNLSRGNQIKNLWNVTSFNYLVVGWIGMECLVSSRDNREGIATGYGREGWGLFPGRENKFSLLYSV